MLRHTELNTDIVTWTRLLTRGTPTHTDHGASHMAAQETKSKQNSGGQNYSPPSSPLTSHSGESTPKSPNTPNNLERDDGPPINGVLPPPIPISEEDLAPSSRINDHPILPPPQEFRGSVEDLARRRASESALIQPVGGAGHAPTHLHSEGVNPMSPNRHQHHHAPHHYHQQSPQHNSNMGHNSNMATVQEVGNN